MNIWLTSDTHFGNVGILRFRSEFESVHHMDSALIEAWNLVVKKGDIVWHLGDFALAPLQRCETYYKMLNGDTRFVLGNHDNQNHLRKLTPLVYMMRMISFHEQKIWLCHYPMRVWPDVHKGSYHAYGHCHGDLDRQRPQNQTSAPYEGSKWGRSCDVGVDTRIDFTPINVDDFLVRLSERPSIVHHPH